MGVMLGVARFQDKQKSSRTGLIPGFVSFFHLAEMVGFEPGFLQFAKKDGSKEGPINCQKQEVVCHVKNIDIPTDKKLGGSFVGTNWPVFLER